MTDTTTAAVLPRPARATHVVLGENQYGKAEVRLVKITRDSERHEIEDLNVTSQLRGDFVGAHLDGDNSHVVATDTQKNTVYSLAREGVGAPESFLLRLSEHFTGSFDWVTGGRWAAESYAWDRIVDHDHAFVRNGQGVRTAVVVTDGDETRVLGGVKDLTVLKSTGSGFVGFPRDRYTSLPETTDRILATDVAARWRYASTDVDFDRVFARARATLLRAFTEGYSAALQQTMYNMGAAVLEENPEIEEIRLSMPNKHHFLVDLAPYGLDNPNEVFFAADRPYGLIEAALARDDASPAGSVWDHVAGFC